MTRKVLLTTRLPKKLRNILMRERFETKIFPKLPKLIDNFYAVTVCTIKLDVSSPVKRFV